MTQKNKDIGQVESLIIQGLASVSFITELNRSSFLESDFYRDMEFCRPDFKPLLKQISIGNQGMMVMFFYALLVVPKERLKGENNGKYDREYEKLNIKIDKFKTLKETTNCDKSDTGYIRHMRNALAHGTVESTKNGITFKDAYHNKSFSVELPLDEIEHLLEELQRILNMYIKDIQSRS